MTSNAQAYQKRLEAMVAAAGSLKEAHGEYSNYEYGDNLAQRNRIKKAHDSVAEAIASVAKKL